MSSVVCASCEGRLGEDVRVAVAGLELSGREWTTLLLSQLWIFFGVAGADGRVDDAEVTSLRLIHGRPDRREDPLLAAMTSVLRDDFWGLVERHGDDRRSVQVGLADARRILGSRLDAERAARVRVGLVRLGVSVARASGLSLFGLAHRLHEDEVAVLRRMSDLLGLSEEERSEAGLRPGA